MPRIGLLFCALALCGMANALWMRRQADDSRAAQLALPESFVADEAQIEALRLALAPLLPRPIEARTKSR